MTISNEITVVVNGNEYKGRYDVVGNVVTVRSAYGTKSTQIGNLEVEMLAKMLLNELVRERKD